ncbi:TPA: hypothetical protein HA246_02055 [Candidatus Woesearchaeota archaeon]|nr:hypothetical protein [Candidatus Woesearchaeota archaeon]HIH42405.1 hypothetical protein [Candidatus Woesearchaeota archaeon]
MEAITKTRKIGGSLMVTIPRNIVEKEGLIENQIIKIEIEKIRKSGFGLHKGLVPFTKEDAFKGQLEK